MRTRTPQLRAAAPPPPPPPPSRRALLARTAAAVVVTLVAPPSLVKTPPPAAAADVASAPSFVPDLQPTPLPSDFVDTSRRLVDSLRTAVEVDRSDAGEFEVREGEREGVCVFCWRRIQTTKNNTLHPPTHPPQVRRKAEPAKNLVRDWMARYGGAGGPAVGGTRTHTALSSAIRTLGDFYRARGARARLDKGTAAALLAALDDAEAGLPAK